MVVDRICDKVLLLKRGGSVLKYSTVHELLSKIPYKYDSELPHPFGWGFLRVLRTIPEIRAGYSRFTFGCMSQLTKKLLVGRPLAIMR